MKRIIIILGCILAFSTSLVPASFASDEPQSPQAIEIGKTYALPSKILGQTRRINVYLPPGYDKNSQPYPVVYLLDGGVAEDFLHIVGIASLAADFRNMREFIVVGIEGIDRYHDLTHPTTVEAERKKLPTNGGSAAFRSFLADELQPFVKKTFRVTDETVLMGESAAGLFVVETLLRRPDLFEGYIAVSPSLWWDGQSLAKDASALFKKGPFPANRRLYLTIADEGGEMRQAVDLVAQAVKTQAPKDFNLTFAPKENETHGTIFHPAALEALRKFFATTK